MTQMPIGGVKGGKRCRFYASDGDVKYETADGSTEYPWHDHVDKYMQERIRWVLLMESIRVLNYGHRTAIGVEDIMVKCKGVKSGGYYLAIIGDRD